MERTKGPPSKAKSEAQVEVERSPVRCPYCHDHCGPEDEAAIVCQQCLSRHHGACWREGSSQCASCGSSKALSGSPPAIKVAKAEMELVKRGLSREAVERLARREGVSEEAATVTLLEAASKALFESSRLPPGAIVAIVAIVFAFAIPILALILGR